MPEMFTVPHERLLLQLLLLLFLLMLPVRRSRLQPPNPIPMLLRLLLVVIQFPSVLSITSAAGVAQRSTMATRLLSPFSGKGLDWRGGLFVSIFRHMLMAQPR